MARDPTEKVRAAAEAVLVDGEAVTSKGVCWAAQRRGRVPLPFLARRQYLLALTDRRVLVFERGRRPKPSDLVLGKRYETFSLEGVRRGFPLLQVRVRAANGNRMVFEFRPGQRELGGELVARLTPRTTDTAAATDIPPDATLDASPTARSDEPRPFEPLTSVDDESDRDESDRDDHDEADHDDDEPDTASTTPERDTEVGAGIDADVDADTDAHADTDADTDAAADAKRDPVSPWTPSTSSDETF